MTVAQREQDRVEGVGVAGCCCVVPGDSYVRCKHGLLDAMVEGIG